MKVIILLIVFIVLIVFFVAKYHKANPISSPNESVPMALDDYFKAIPTMSTEELDAIHNALLPYASKVSLTGLSEAFTTHGVSENKTQVTVEEKRKMLLPCGKIYGCRTYGEAQMLNKAVVAELDDRDDGA